MRRSSASRAAGWRRPVFRGLRPFEVWLANCRMTLECHYMKTHLVTTLKRKSTGILDELVIDQTTVLITKHGVPTACLVDVTTFEASQNRIRVLEAIARGERAIQDGRTFTHAQAKRRLQRWLA